MSQPERRLRRRAPVAEVLAWNRRTLRDAYRNVGVRDARWDRAALEALAAFAVIRSGQATSGTAGVLEAAIHRARAAGCGDALL